MSDAPGDSASNVAWRRLRRDRPWYRKIAGQPLAEARVESPDGRTYLVRVSRNSAWGGARGIDASDPLSAIAGLAKAGVSAVVDDPGWTIAVVAPARGWGRETGLYTQRVGAQAILVDVILAVCNALERGDKLWPEEDE